MLIDIKSLEDLEREAATIDSFLNITCSEDINEAAARGNELSVYIARTGKMLADAKYHRDIAIKINTDLVNETYRSLSPTIKKNLINSMCANENYIVNWIDRLNRTATHQLSYMVTLISKAKVELSLTPRI